jgi:hypothetical protein
VKTTTTRPLGTRLFQLDLGPVTLALIGCASHAALDRLQETHSGKGYEFCEDILRLKKIPYKHLMSDDATDTAEKRGQSLPAGPGPAGERRHRRGAAGVCRQAELEARSGLPAVKTRRRSAGRPKRRRRAS